MGLSLDVYTMKNANPFEIFSQVLVGGELHTTKFKTPGCHRYLSATLKCGECHFHEKNKLVFIQMWCTRDYCKKEKKERGRSKVACMLFKPKDQ